MTTPAPGPTPPTVAIVDDHELVREGLRSLLEARQQPIARVVYCGAVPVDAAASRPDVALLDIDLGPGSPTLIDAIGILQRANAHVLLVSAFEQGPAVRSALRAGVLGFIPKRVSIEVLQEAIATVARGELYLSPDLASILAGGNDAPELSPRELDALRLYAAGLKLAAVAHRMGISPHTVKEYLDRVRAKYAGVGRQARTRTELYVEAQRDGLLVEPARPNGGSAPGVPRNGDS